MNEVLIVEDDPGVRLFLRATLSALHFPHRSARSAAQALAAARAAMPGVIVLDLTLPGLDGWAVWRAVMALAGARPPRVIVLSGDLSPAEQAEAAARGVWAVLRKPASRAQLADVVRRALDSIEAE